MNNYLISLVIEFLINYKIIFNFERLIFLAIIFPLIYSSVYTNLEQIIISFKIILQNHFLIPLFLCIHPGMLALINLSINLFYLTTIYMNKLNQNRIKSHSLIFFIIFFKAYYLINLIILFIYYHFHYINYHQRSKQSALFIIIIIIL